MGIFFIYEVCIGIIFNVLFYYRHVIEPFFLLPDLFLTFILNWGLANLWYMIEIQLTTRQI